MNFSNRIYNKFAFPLNGSSFYFSKTEKRRFSKDGFELDQKELGFPMNMPLFFTEEFDFIEEENQLRVTITEESK